jgi:hypothetical protein
MIFVLAILVFFAKVETAAVAPQAYANNPGYLFRGNS